MNLEFINDYPSYKFNLEEFFNTKVKTVFSTEGLEKEINLCVVFMSDNDLLEVNKEHLNHDYFTDIITFPIEESDESLDADIYISIDRVRDNAQKFGVEFNNELLRVVLHGCLHLCGYLDKSEADVKVMRSKEEFYLKA